MAKAKSSKGRKRKLKKPKRNEEVFDSEDKLQKKCRKLVKALKNAKCPVIYTGAGISTAASIPDYRGPEGVWTLSNKGLPVPDCNPTQADPTLTHMALRELYRAGIIHHIVSQNCDGLHLRSGIPQKSLSEVHGNMYIEVCTNCQPQRQYIRKFDVTKATRFRHHKTGRKCDVCRGDLIDTIVHFGESGKLPWPLNWSTAIQTAASTDLIVCLGSSLQILKKYTFLWGDSRPRGASKPKLFIVNLQWTPKDRFADEKIHGKCDDVLSIIMKQFGMEIPAYCRDCDPVLSTLRRNSKNVKLMNEISVCRCSPAMPMMMADDASATSGLSTSSSSDQQSAVHILPVDSKASEDCMIEKSGHSGDLQSNDADPTAANEQPNKLCCSSDTKSLSVDSPASCSTAFAVIDRPSTSSSADDASEESNNVTLSASSDQLPFAWQNRCSFDFVAENSNSSFASTAVNAERCSDSATPDSLSSPRDSTINLLNAVTQPAVATASAAELKAAKKKERLSRLLKSLETWDKYRKGAVVEDCAAVPSASIVGVTVEATPSSISAASILPGWWSTGLAMGIKQQQQKKRLSTGSKKSKRGNKRRKLSRESSCSSLATSSDSASVSVSGTFTVADDIAPNDLSQPDVD